ncbi:hypothetical protein AV654_15250 [Paenibacillus elgii]|uniref:Uncharacterized protein n=1 Tax=Paenibacillus elgii TaxID=189691 RepID=A0A163YN00_9BACL|nr:hypothetical protein [Paenibacillus elgii]KZE79656.1 hypothetical protein AV654_15250 [Paenibacillus elgii]
MRHRQGKLIEEPVFQGNGSLYKQGEAGLLGFALDPHFARNGYMDAYHIYGRRMATRSSGLYRNFKS